MNFIKFFLINCLLIFFCNLAICQESDYLKDFDWMVKTFEDNDAGYKYYLTKIGVDEYSNHVSTYRERIKKASSNEECISIMNGWLGRFRKGHIGVSQKKSSILSVANDDSIRAIFKDEKRIKLKMDDFYKYLRSNKIHPIEGIWEYGQYQIGIIRSKKNSNQFDGIIIKADSVYWLPGQRKVELSVLNDSTFDATFYMKDHSPKKTKVKWFGDSYGLISMSDFLWIKKYPEIAHSTHDSILYDSGNSEVPFLRRISKKSLYLRIPSFKLEQKDAIDSLLARNDSLIKSTDNLIIDIRWGTGGSDYSHYGLIPYYYTQPIRTMGLVYRATEANAREYERFANIHTDSTRAQNCREIAKKMRDNIGGYYDPGNRVWVTDEFKSLKYPLRIAIICNSFNGSADEQFLFMARQSYKVKIFGRPTLGVYDFSNVNAIDFPDGKFVLYLAMTASNRYPDYIIDNVGIQPDYYIDDTIDESDWIDYVKSVIEDN